MTSRALLVLVLTSFSFAQKTKSPPRFEEFSANDTLTGRRATPILRTNVEITHRTRIREEAKLPPNFAGKFRIVKWGCGSDCVAFVVVDLKTGEVYDPPFGSLWLVAFTERWRGEGLDYKRNSRLLVADGCPTEACGTFYYEWTGREFTQLRSVKKSPEW